jgi:hypothetical protein
MSNDEWRRWYWGEGNKYVIEGGKALILINGVAATAILTFIGNEHLPRSRGLFWAIIIFASGAFVGVCLFALAYIVQLQYGNERHAEAVRLHERTYYLAVASAALLVIGMVIAALSVPSDP